MSKNRTTSTESTTTTQPKAHISGVAITLAFILYLAAFFAGIGMSAYNVSVGLILAVTAILALVGTYLLLALKIAAQWEKAVVLRLGKFRRLAGPGLFWIIPVVDTIANWIDHRVMVTPFSAEKTLTKDTVPVDVDAVLFWMVWDAEKAALEVENYRSAITWAAQSLA